MTRKTSCLATCVLLRRRRNIVAVTLALTALLTVTVAGTAMAASVTGVSGGSTNPGGQATVTVEAQEVTSVAINNIPDDWSIASSSTDAGVLIGNPQTDVVISYAAVGQQSSVSISVTFDIPSNASAQENDLKIVASGTESDETATATVTVQQTSGDGSGETNETDTEEGETEGETDGDGTGEGSEEETGGGEAEGEDDGGGNGGEGGQGQGMPGFGVFVALAALVCYAYAARRSQS